MIFTQSFVCNADNIPVGVLQSANTAYVTKVRCCYLEPTPSTSFLTSPQSEVNNSGPSCLRMNRIILRCFFLTSNPGGTRPDENVFTYVHNPGERISHQRTTEIRKSVNRWTELK